MTDELSKEAAEIERLLPFSFPGLTWVVVHVRPRCEKKLVMVCGEQDLSSYLPVKRKVHYYGRRERVFLTPLFSGYIFCLVTDDQRVYLRQNQYVANLLEVAEQDKLVRQLRQIHQALQLGDAVEVMPYLEKGNRVCVTGGALKGLEGIIENVKGGTRIIISVEMIRQSVGLEVDAALLAPVN